MLETSRFNKRLPLRKLCLSLFLITASLAVAIKRLLSLKELSTGLEKLFPFLNNLPKLLKHQHRVLISSFPLLNRTGVRIKLLHPQFNLKIIRLSQNSRGVKIKLLHPQFNLKVIRLSQNSRGVRIKLLHPQFNLKVIRLSQKLQILLSKSFLQRSHKGYDPT